jgi:hypothetical protein
MDVLRRRFRAKREKLRRCARFDVVHDGHPALTRRVTVTLAAS